ncbi:MAG: hypothetical protein HYR84_06765 [Planctomycetes bacterium]|nr:hypothetical protein [Planctomycetota bacterium]
MPNIIAFNHVKRRTTANPGSDTKMLVMSLRAGLGLPLFNPLDGSPEFKADFAPVSNAPICKFPGCENRRENKGIQQKRRIYTAIPGASAEGVPASVILQFARWLRLTG